MGGLMVVRPRIIEEEEVVEERVAICDRVVWYHCAMVSCHVVFVPLCHCPLMVVHHHHHHVAMRDQVVAQGRCGVAHSSGEGPHGRAPNVLAPLVVVPFILGPGSWVLGLGSWVFLTHFPA